MYRWAVRTGKVKKTRKVLREDISLELAGDGWIILKCLYV